ncbi:unnamed protein product [Leuciscus chuanchicus]
MSTMHTLFESAEEFSSSEISDDLITALAAGQWWAIVAASVLISEHPEYGYLISGQSGETVETGETSCPTSLVFSDASEKADSGDGPKSDPGSLDQIDDLCSMFAKCCVISDITMPDNISERQKQKIPEPEIAMSVCCSQGAPVINMISERSTEASDNAGLCQAPPQKLCVELRRNNHPAPQITTSQLNPGTLNRHQSRPQRIRKRALPEIAMSVCCSQGAPVINSISERQKQMILEPEIAMSDNAGLCQAPPQKLCVELRRNNHPAPQITTSQLNPGTPNRHQSRPQPIRKRALDSAGEDWSPPQKKQRMEIKVNGTPSV